VQFQSVHGQLGFDFKAGRLRGKALHEPPRKGPISGKDVARGAGEEPYEEPGQQPITEGMARPVSGCADRFAHPHHHVLPMKDCIHQ